MVCRSLYRISHDLRLHSCRSSSPVPVASDFHSSYRTFLHSKCHSCKSSFRSVAVQTVPVQPSVLPVLPADVSLPPGYKDLQIRPAIHTGRHIHTHEAIIAPFGLPAALFIASACAMPSVAAIILGSVYIAVFCACLIASASSSLIVTGLNATDTTEIPLSSDHFFVRISFIASLISIECAGI